MSLALSKIDLIDAAAVWRRNLLVYRRLWLTEIISPIIEPVFMFLAFGFGVGSLIAAQVEGLSYLSFVGAGVLGFAVMTRTIFELTYGAYFRMVHQGTYDAILATPVTVESLAFGEIIWGLTKSAIDCAFILLVLTLFGAVSSWFAPAAFVPLLIGCLALGGLSLGATAHIYNIEHFQIFFAVFFSTVFLCGAWFSIETLPLWLRIFAYILPTTGAIDVTRACLVGKFEWRHLLEIIYLSLISILLLEWAIRSLRRRMVI